MRLKTYLKGLGLGIFVTALIMSLTAKETKSGMSDAEIMARAAELGMVSENAMLLKEAQDLADRAQDRAAKQNGPAAVSDDAPPVSENSANDRAAVSINGQISGNKTVSSNGEIIELAPAAVISGNITDKGAAEPASTAAIPADTALAATDKATEKEDKASVAGTGRSQGNDASPAEDSEPAQEETAPDESVQEDTAPETTAQAQEVIVINVSSGDSSASVASKMVKAGLIEDARQFDSYLVLSGYDRKLVVGPHPIPKGATASEMGAILTSRQ